MILSGISFPSHMTPRITLFTLLTVLYPIAVQSQTPEFTVTGTLSLQETNFHAKAARTLDTQFVLSVRDSNWKIQTTYGKGHYSMYGFDGTNTYGCMMNETEAEKLQLKSGPGSILKGGYPAETTWYTTVPWLAYASSSYLKQQSTVPPVWLLSFADPLAGAFTSKTERDNLPPQLPFRVEYTIGQQEVDQLKKGEFRTISAVSDTEREETIIRAGLLQPGFLEARYQVDTYTNFNGLNLPLTFTLTKYVKVKEGVATHYTIKGTAHKFENTPVARFTPKPAFTVDVVDFRVQQKDKGVDFVRYQMEGANWPDENSPVVQNALNAALARNRFVFKNNKGFIAAMVLCMACVPPFALLVRARFKKQKGNQP